MRQTGASHCGVACLAMMLGYFGRTVDLSEVVDAVAPTLRGSTALSIVTAARRLGLQARGWAAPYEALPDLQLPAVVHVVDSHFVVLEAVTGAGVAIVDPAAGRRLLTHEWFRQAYTGTVITFAEDPDVGGSVPGAVPDGDPG